MTLILTMIWSPSNTALFVTEAINIQQDANIISDILIKRPHISIHCTSTKSKEWEYKIICWICENIHIPEDAKKMHLLTGKQILNALATNEHIIIQRMSKSFYIMKSHIHQKQNLIDSTKSKIHDITHVA